jgi:DNA-binding SARP family transcriptional activator
MPGQHRLDRGAVHQAVGGVERVQADQHFKFPGEVRRRGAVAVVPCIEGPRRGQPSPGCLSDLWGHLVHAVSLSLLDRHGADLHRGDTGGVQIAVLGPLQVRDAETVIEIAGARLRSLLTVLALEAPRPVSGSALVDAVWGDSPPSEQANALQSLVSRLRRTLGDAGLIQQSPAGYRLAVAPDDIDIHRFDQLTRCGGEALRAGDPHTAADRLTEALQLWRGDPVEVAESGHARLVGLEDALLEARADLIESQLSLGAAAAVIVEVEALVTHHPLRERFVGLLVTALSAAGRQADALAAYERARVRLADELGIDPSPELQATYLNVLRGESAHDPTAAPARRNLRASLTSFVGRDEQLAQIAALLASTRLVTLVGPGGAGKTRLAGEAAAAIAPGSADVVWLAELAPVTDPSDVAQTVLGSLGLREAVLLERAGAMTPRDAIGRLIDALADSSAVLVLDNCEHLIDAAAHLADQMLARCRDCES